MNILEVLKKLEWSGETEGAPFGMGERGPIVPCCPLCKRIKPGHGRVAAMTSSEGHDEECELKGLIREFTVPNWATSLSTAPTDAPRWKASGGEEYLYTVSGDWLLINEQHGSLRIRQICKILKEFRVGPNGVSPT